MKLRCQSNSVRLRLKRGEVARLAETGRIEESIAFPQGTLRYVIEALPAAALPAASFREGMVVVVLPADAVHRWAGGDEIGIGGDQALPGGGSLRILVEKDFACLDANDEQNVDTFPNPLAGTKC